MISEQSQQAYSDIMRPEMVPFLPDEYSNVLEIGCNDGNFRKYVSKPCEYWGVEPFKGAADIAKTRMNRVLTGFYDEVENQIPDDYFDLIIANDVIEHMEQPWNFLRTIKKKMKKNASLVLSIPNVRYYKNLKELLCDRDWEYKDEGILDITHLRFFTEKSIVRLLNENYFEIEKMQGIGPKVKKRYLFLLWVLKIIFGKDVEFLQFGVRAKI
ncbi:MAG: class I SAM-dependent methyltransferase [Fibromonadales bacterium]|nr:class I SAM-dependent methyltransferase [Fibromonadales bacterium]